MKNKHLLLLIVVFISVLAISCQNTYEKMIGKWQVSKVDFEGIKEYATKMANQLSSLPEELTQKYIETLIEQIKSNINSTYQLAYFEFTADKKFIISYDLQPDNIMYELKPLNSNKFEAAHENIKLDLTVKKIEKNKMVLEILQKDNLKIILELERK